MKTHWSRAMEASLVSDVAGLNQPAGRDRAVVGVGEGPAAAVSLRLPLALLLI